MARTPLFALLRRAARLALVANRRATTDTAAVVEEQRAVAQAARAARAQARWDRRSVLQAGAVLGAGFALGGLASGCSPRRAYIADSTGPISGVPRVAIVGAGLAGLTAAWHLKNAGVPSTIYEASPRLGGRTYSGRDVVGTGLVTELGGEFIDSIHEDMLGLVEHFGLELIDVQGAAEHDLASDAFYFEGRHFSEQDVVDALRPYAERMAADLEPLGDDTTYQDAGGAEALDALSIAAYLDQLGMSGWLRKLIEVAYVTEYGAELDDQSALNLLYMIETDLSSDEFAIFGASDERYKIVGGNQSVATALAADLEAEPLLGHRLESIRWASSSYRLHFSTGDDSKPVLLWADVVILTLPFSMLRKVDIRIELPDLKRCVIDELPMGNCTKLMMGLRSRPWRELGYGGNVFGDAPFQLAWDNSRGQAPAEAGTAAGMTVYQAGRHGERALDKSDADAAGFHLDSLDMVFPGVRDAFTGTARRFHWPTHPFTLGAYSYYRPGQWSSLRGAEGEPVGNIYFAGEHCSLEYQGYMNGAAETGRLAAEALLARMGRHAK